MVSQHNAVVALFFDKILSAKCLNRKQSFADMCKYKLVMHRNVTRKHGKLFPNTACPSWTKLINSFKTVHLHEIKIMSHTSCYEVWRVWPMYFIVSRQNLNSKKIINGLNAFSRNKSKIIWNAVKNHPIKLIKKGLSKKIWHVWVRVHQLPLAF